MKQNNVIEKEFSVIILAAGKSERMGFPKLSLKYNEKENFIEHIISEYLSFGCKDIAVVVNEIGFEYLNKNEIQFPDIVKVVINEHPDWHRFYSLKIGAKSLSETHSVFIHNVDNPFVNNDVLKVLYNNKNKADYINPEYEGKGGHPILLSKKIIEELRSIEEDQIHLKDFLNQYSRLRIKVDDNKVLANINTIEEYRKNFD
jgi:molybdenum cofactor cytidylyltransferase